MLFCCNTLRLDRKPKDIEFTGNWTVIKCHTWKPWENSALFDPNETGSGQTHYHNPLVGIGVGIGGQPHGTEIPKEPQHRTYWRPQMCEARDPIGKVILSKVICESEVPSVSGRGRWSTGGEAVHRSATWSMIASMSSVSMEDPGICCWMADPNCQILALMSDDFPAFPSTFRLGRDCKKKPNRREEVTWNIDSLHS